MGLTIFYSGRIKDMRLLPALANEVKDICHDLHWVYGDFAQADEIPLKGIQFHPPGCDPVWLTFRSDGMLADPVYFVFKDDSFAPPEAGDQYRLDSVTQFAGIEAHMELIRLLKYLSAKYFDDFELVDESDYWETGDAEICKFHFKEFERLMDEMAMKLAHLDGLYGLSGNSVRKRMDDLLHTKGINEILKAFR